MSLAEILVGGILIMCAGIILLTVLVPFDKINDDKKEL